MFQSFKVLPAQLPAHSLKLTGQAEPGKLEQACSGLQARQSNRLYCARFHGQLRIAPGVEWPGEAKISQRTSFSLFSEKTKTNFLSFYYTYCSLLNVSTKLTWLQECRLVKILSDGLLTSRGFERERERKKSTLESDREKFTFRRYKIRVPICRTYLSKATWKGGGGVIISAKVSSIPI